MTQRALDYTADWRLNLRHGEILVLRGRYCPHELTVTASGLAGCLESHTRGAQGRGGNLDMPNRLAHRFEEEEQRMAGALTAGDKVAKLMTAASVTA